MPRLTIDVRGLQLVASSFGDDHAPLVLLIHGFLDCGRSWTDVAEQLAERYRVVAPDMRGFGESGWVGAGGYYHFYDYYDDVLHWLRELGADQFSLVGHSMGGSIAAGVAAIAADRCRHLVLLEGLGPPANDPQHSVTRLRQWANAMGREKTDGDIAHRRSHRKTLPSVEAAATRLRKYNPRLDEALSLRLADYLTEQLAAGGVAFRHDPMHITPAAKPYWIEEARQMWRTISAPTLLLSGAQSTMPTEDFEGRFAYLANARSLLVPGAGHNIHHDRPALVAGAIDAWLSRQPERMPAELNDGMPTTGRPGSH